MEVYVQASAVPLSTKNVVPEVTRRSANFHPSVWGDHFLAYTSNLTQIYSREEKQLQQLKEEVRKMLVAATEKPLQKLNLIDEIQRLGVSYHFTSEIDAALQHIHESYQDSDDEEAAAFHSDALWFRLLRQQGHNVSCYVFNKFKDSDGKFKESLVGDLPGLLSLYEASHLRLRGEDILDEALTFTTTNLEAMTPHLSKAVAEKVTLALKQPIRKGLTRVEARVYMSIYQENDLQNKILLKFAKLDFNLLQKLHQRELNAITRWWKDLDFTNKLPFARDRVVECYFWTLGVYFEPQYNLARMILTKVIAITSIIDDIYDASGTLEELTLFTDAIERFDVTALGQLPSYMSVCYRALLDVYDEMEEEMAKEGRSYRVHYAKAAMKSLVKANYQEAKWLDKGYVPTMEEYMQVRLVSGAYIMLATTSFVGMGEVVTEESFDWVSSDPLIVRASSVICRLMNDMAGHKFEQEREHIPSAIECYMRQHGAAEEEAIAEFQEQVSNAWKDINQECLRPTAVPMPLLTRVLNLARVINLLYQDEDGYTHSKTRVKDLITSLLVDSVPI